MPDSLHDIFIGRQPILDRDQQIVAYELLFRSSGQSTSANITNDLLATAHVITHAFSELGIASVLGDKKGYINVNADLLLSDMIELLPQDKVVIELLETIQVDEQIISRCQELKAMGFSLALDDFGGDSQFKPLFDIVEVIKIDLPQMGQEGLEINVKYLKNWPVKLLAEKVEDIDQAIQCKGLGFDLFQGYYYARPVILSGKRADSSKLMLLKLLELILGDAETHEIEQAFKHDPSLSYNLLRLVNSVAVGSHYKISSLKQAIVVLGRQQLQRWLQLLLFVNQGGDMHSPLLELAATRGKLMELLAVTQSERDKDLHDRAFMTGIMSLLDTLLGMPIEEVVKQVNLASDVENALLKHEGKLGKLLLLVEKMEQNDFDAAEGLLADMQLNLGNLMQAQIEAMSWANQLNKTAED
ncbi:cyclic diguanylate phosphodiesterase [Sulfuricella sp. T08]|uniref:EAL and HDOD domain-containing protein n=1 Tax=Sulfuricella sp. T08 TaxID=1632857 RepID=UPI0006179702|nr:EAL domain-containing protein [Sulfuricella sp. T08]GAO36961.1 cyclic diguanylate phosphodiesterase [Sulfuricella sp. T08]